MYRLYRAACWSMLASRMRSAISWQYGLRGTHAVQAVHG